MRALLVRTLGSTAHEVVAHAVDADAAVAAASVLKPDVLIVDGRLPDGPVHSIVARILEVAPATAVFVLVSIAEREQLQKALAAGARGGLVRPLRAADLYDALARLENT